MSSSILNTIMCLKIIRLLILDKSTNNLEGSCWFCVFLDCFVQNRGFPTANILTTLGSYRLFPCILKYLTLFVIVILLLVHVFLVLHGNNTTVQCVCFTKRHCGRRPNIFLMYVSSISGPFESIDLSSEGCIKIILCHAFSLAQYCVCDFENSGC